MIRKVSRGDPLKIKATEWNAIADEVNALRGGGAPGDPNKYKIENCIINAYNNAGVDFEQFDVVSISSAAYETSEAYRTEKDENNLVYYPVFYVNEADKEGINAILLDDLKASSGGTGEIKKALVSGCYVVKLNVNDEDHQWAGITDDGGNTLQTLPHETSQKTFCQILWREAGTGERFAFIRVSNYNESQIRWAQYEETLSSTFGLGCYPLDTFDSSPDTSEQVNIVWAYSTSSQRAAKINNGAKIPYLPLRGEDNRGVALGQIEQVDVEGDDDWIELDKSGPDDLYKHIGPKTDDTTTYEFSVVTDIERDDGDIWDCGDIYVYRKIMKWDSKGHVFDPDDFDSDDGWIYQY